MYLHGLLHVIFVHNSDTVQAGVIQLILQGKKGAQKFAQGRPVNGSTKINFSFLNQSPLLVLYWLCSDRLSPKFLFLSSTSLSLEVWWGRDASCTAPRLCCRSLPLKPILPTSPDRAPHFPSVLVHPVCLCVTNGAMWYGLNHREGRFALWVSA